MVSNIGMLLEVDWPALFANLFAIARVRVRCKSPSRIPLERVFEMDGGCFVVSFKTEGVKQMTEKSDDEDDKGDDDSLEDEDLLDDNANDQPKKEGEQQGEDQKKESKGKKGASLTLDGVGQPSSVSKGSKSTKGC